MVVPPSLLEPTTTGLSGWCYPIPVQGANWPSIDVVAELMAPFSRIFRAIALHTDRLLPIPLYIVVDGLYMLQCTSVIPY